MSRRKRKERTYMPASTAGLLSFYQEEIKGFKVKPMVIIAGIIGVIVIEIIVRLIL